MKDKYNKIILGLAIVFFLVYLFPVVTVIWPNMQANDGQFISSWPDSMANHLFVDQFIKTGSFSYPEELNQVLENTVHPRSVNIYGDSIVPMGFLGLLFIFGPLGLLLSSYGVLILTALLSVVSAFCFYKITSQLFDRQTGLIAYVLLLILPPYLYYSQLPMLPNILFVSLVIIGLYFYLKESSKTSNYLWAGLLLGLALVTRPIEFMWLGALVALPAIFYWRKIRLKSVLVFIFSVASPLVLMLIVNYFLYGNPFYLGYFNLALADPSTLWQRLPGAFMVDSGRGLLSYVKLVVAPFGLHWSEVGHNFNTYFIALLWPYFTLFCAGFVLFLSRLRRGKQVDGKNESDNEEIVVERKKHLLYWSVTILVGIWLIIYYGSWMFDDKLMLKLNTIGISYVRYWLPLFILIIPGIAYLINSLLKVLKLNWQRWLLIVVLFSLFVSFSVNLAYLSKGDGLIDQRKVIDNYYSQFNTVKDLVEPDSIIVNDREDKVLFPHFPVIMFGGNFDIFPPLEKIIDQQPVYYLSQVNEDMYQRIETRLNDMNWHLEFAYVVDDHFTLYRLERMDNIE